jgi:hypothetical protein
VLQQAVGCARCRTRVCRMFGAGWQLLHQRDCSITASVFNVFKVSWPLYANYVGHISPCLGCSERTAGWWAAWQQQVLAVT